MSISQGTSETVPSGMDLFVSLRHFAPDGAEILYTGSMGEGVPATKGFLRLALRKTNPQHPHHRPWQPHRDYTAADVLPVVCGEVYPVDVELWPTNLVVAAGGRLSFEISSRDTDGSGVFMHTDPQDRLVEPSSFFVSFDCFAHISSSWQVSRRTSRFESRALRSGLCKLFTLAGDSTQELSPDRPVIA